MTPAQRLAHALYGSCEPERVQEARDFAKRLKESGFAIVPVSISDEHAEGIWSAAYDEWAEFGSRDEDAGRAALAAAIQAYQQEIETCLSGLNMQPPKVD